MVFSDLVNKSDNACEHHYKLNEFGKCHSLSPPFRERTAYRYAVPHIHYIMDSDFCQSKQVPEHILKHFRKVFRLFIFGNFLLCNEAPPLIADSMLVLSEMFKTLLVVLLADKDGLTERSILHKTAHKEYPFAVVHFFLSRGQNAILLCNRLSDQVFVVFKIIPLVCPERTGFSLPYAFQNPPVLLLSWRL